MSEPSILTAPPRTDNAAPLPVTGNVAMAGLYRAALGPVQMPRYLALFERFDHAGRAPLGWNMAASLLTLNWMALHCLWGAALVYLALVEGLVLLVFGIGRQLMDWPMQVQSGLFTAVALFAIALPGLFGDALLHSEIRKRIQRTLAVAKTMPQAYEMLARQASSQQRLSAIVAINVLLFAIATTTWALWPASAKGDASPAPSSEASGKVQYVAGPLLTPTPPAPALSAALAPAEAPAQTPPQTPPAPPIATAPATPQPLAPAASGAPTANSQRPLVPAQASPTPPVPTPTPAPAPIPKPVPAPPPPPPAPAAVAKKVAQKAVEKVAPKPAEKTPTRVDQRAAKRATAKAIEKSAKKSPKKEPAVAPVIPLPPPPPPLPEIAAPTGPLPLVGSTPGYYLSVGIFSEAGNARRAQAKLLNAGMPAFRQTLGSAGNERIRLRVGPYSSQAEIQKAAAQIRELGLEAVPFVKRSR